MVAHGCPRCGGSMFRERAAGELDFYCLQCGCRASSLTRPNAKLIPVGADRDLARRLS